MIKSKYSSKNRKTFISQITALRRKDNRPILLLLLIFIGMLGLAQIRDQIVVPDQSTIEAAEAYRAKAE